jgi:hypothetical protein
VNDARRRAGEAAPLAALQDPWLLAALSGASVLLLAAAFPLWGAAWRVVCPLRALTGIPCPTCYGTRAMLALLTGDWQAALRLNPLVALGGMGLAAFVPWAFATVLLHLPRPRVSAAVTARFAWVGAGATIVNWLYLIIAHGPA